MIFVTVTGNLGKDAEIRDAGGTNVCKFSIASTKKSRGEETTTWIDCDLWGKRGDSLCQYLTKGSKVVVVGELTTRVHNGKTYLGVRVSDLEFNGGGRSNQSQSAPSQQPLSDGRQHEPLGGGNNGDGYDSGPLPF